MLSSRSMTSGAVYTCLVHVHAALRVSQLTRGLLGEALPWQDQKAEQSPHALGLLYRA